MKNTHAVIVSPDVDGSVCNGNIGAFVHHFARLLKQNGHRVTVLFTGGQEGKTEESRFAYDAAGIDFVHVRKPYHENVTPPMVARWEFIRRGDMVREHMPPDAEVVYWQDWQEDGFQATRARRISAQPNPLFVTVLHGNSAWRREGMKVFTDTAWDVLSQDFGEHYTTQHSDYVVSPSRYMLNWVSQHGWILPAAERCEVLGFPFLPDESSAQMPSASERFRRLVFFGRLETSKGIELFIETLQHIHRMHATILDEIDEIVLLGKDGQHSYLNSRNIVRMIRNEFQLGITVLSHLDADGTRRYLSDHAADSLVVLPSLSDNFPYAVI